MSLLRKTKRSASDTCKRVEVNILEAAIKLLKEMGLDPTSIERCLAGATNVSINVFEGNENIVVIGGNYFERGSKGNPSQKSKKARRLETESEDDDMGELEDSPEPRSHRDRERSSTQEEESLADKVEAHLIHCGIEIEDIALRYYSDNVLNALLQVTDQDAAYNILLSEDNEDPPPF